MKEPKTAKAKKNLQTEFSFGSAGEKIPHFPNEDEFCPVYFPKSGDELKKLAFILNPILEKTGWGVRFSVENEESFLELFDKGKKRPSRRLTPEEVVAWQAILPELLGAGSVLKDGSKQNRRGF